MATKLSDILNKESTGIMFPFSSSTSSTGVAPVSTTQQVYNTATNGIMTVQGKQYTGPDAIINYGSKEEGYPRNLKQIEKGMLPQFNQSTLPNVGKGTVETGTPTAPVTPPTEEVKTPEPVLDPCPPGYKLVNGVCQQVAQQKPDEPREKIIPTYDTAVGFSNEERLNFNSKLYENGGVDSNSYYGLNNLITKDGNSLSFNFSNLESLKDKNKFTKNTGLGTISNLVNVNGSSVNMKGQMKFLLENNLATSNIDMKLLDPISLNKRPEDTILTLNENGQSFIENIDNVNNALYNKDDFGNIKGKGLFNFLGTKYGSGGIGLNSKEMNSLIVDLAAQYNSASAQYLLNTKNPGLKFNTGGSFYHINKLGYGKQYDINKFSKAVQKQYNEARKDDVMSEAKRNQKESRTEAEKQVKEANSPENMAAKAAKTATEKKDRKSQGGFKSKEQLTKDFKTASKKLSDFNKTYRGKK